MSGRKCCLFLGFVLIACLSSLFAAGCGTAEGYGQTASGTDPIARSTTTVTEAPTTSTMSLIAGPFPITQGNSTATVPSVPSATGPPLIGRARASDPPGDVVPFDDQQSVRQPACVDLIAGDLSADGETLTVRLTTRGPIPHSFETDTSSDDQMVGLEFGVWFKHPSGGFDLGAYLWHDWVVDERMSGPPQVSGNLLILTIPLQRVPELAQGFEWTAYSTCDFMVGTTDEKYGDRLPGVASASYSSEDPALPFPEQYLNIESGQPLASSAISDQEGTEQAEAALVAFFRAWGAKDLAAYKALLSERRREEMKLGDWTFAGLDRIEFGRVIAAPEVIDLSIATYGYPYHRGNVAKEDVRCFRASVAWHYKPGVEGPTANGEELPWMWFLVRGADGNWRVDEWGA
jgi:hypothetical protein